jgi:guanylate kinase
MNAEKSRPLLLLVSGPSGSGKTTLCDRMVAEFDSVTYSVSCTTRPMRPGEVDGEDYHFLDEATFVQRIGQGAFLEHARVHGYRYGTLKATVIDAMKQGQDVLMDIDVQGAALIRDAVRNVAAEDVLHGSFVDVFILPPSMDALNQRLHGRGQDRAEVIQTRLANADGEIAHWQDYRYRMVNDDLDASYDVLRAILIAEHHRIGVEEAADVC